MYNIKEVVVEEEEDCEVDSVEKMMEHEEERLQLLISEQLIDMSCHYNLLFLKASVYNVGCSSFFFCSSSTTPNFSDD